MADGTVTIKANFDGKDAESGVSRIKSALSGLKDSGSKIGSVFKSVLGANLLGSAITSSVSALGNGIKGAFAGAIQEGGALQQSVGGVKTLYAGAEKEVMGFAQTAYKAGISANSYMEQATSFGAALKQSFGGDAVKAANAANMAIMDMADNSAKMGTDIGKVQETYQSLARGNYAMLDNLKLGYGGTKSEMQRLLQTASQLTGKNFDLNNFGDIVEAINAVQKDLGLSGTAAKEASETFTGSLNAMKASWSNATGAITSGEIDIGPQLQGLATTTSDFLFGNLFPMIGRVFKELPSAIGTFIEAAKPRVAQGLSNLFKGLKVDLKPEAIERGIDSIVSKLSNFGSQVKQFFSNFANTGAFSALGQAFQSIGGAIKNVLSALGLGKVSFADFGTTLGNVVTKLAEGATKIADFIGKMDTGRLQSWMAAIAAVVGGFKIFNAVTGSSPVGDLLDKLGGKFGLFKSKTQAGMDGAAGATRRSKGVIAQVFNGLGTLITKTGTAISTILQGVGKAISTVIQGMGKVASKANPAQWLSLGAAMLMVGAGVALAAAGIAMLVDAAIRLGEAGTSAGIALAGLVVSIGALAGVFALLGPALTAGAVGIVAFGAAVLMIGAGIAVASAGLSMLAGHLPTIAAYGIQAGAGIAALGASLLVVGAGALVAGAGLMVAGAGLTVVGAGALAAATGAAVLGAGLLVTAAGVTAFGLALRVAKPGVVAFANAITKVVNAVSGGLTSILNSVSGVIQSVGQAALNAGKGFNQLANGVVKITGLNLFDLGASLATVATGLGKIAGHSSGLVTAAQGVQALATGLVTFTSAGTTAVSLLTRLATGFTQLSSQMTSLPPALSAVSAGLTAFASQAMPSMASLTALAVPIGLFRTQLMTMAPALMMAGAGLTMFSTQAMLASSAMTQLAASATRTQVAVTDLGTAIRASMTGAVSAITSAGAQMSSAMQGAMSRVGSAVRSGMSTAASAVRSGGSQMASALRSSGQQMASVMQASVNQISSAVRSGMSQVVSAIQSAGSQMVSAMQSSGSQLVAVTQSAVSQAAAVARGGYGAFFSAGAYMGQGLAAGMNSALGAVTAAANALVAQAERAARAKAQIHSPSRLFKKNVGRWIGAGIAEGIDDSSSEVEGSLDVIRDQVHGFNVKANNLIQGVTARMGSRLELTAQAEQAKLVHQATIMGQSVADSSPASKAPTSNQYTLNYTANGGEENSREKMKRIFKEFAWYMQQEEGRLGGI